MSPCLEQFLGPNPGSYCASAVKRVLELALDEGHQQDPRHRDHWWSWKDWPLDGRQWLQKSGGNYKLDKECVKQHEERSEQDGFHGTKLLIERKLEGIIWDHDKPRTELRASMAVDADVLDMEKFQTDDPLAGLSITTHKMSSRSEWDASVLNSNANFELSPEAKEQFQQANPFAPVLSRFGPATGNPTIFNLNMFRCTGAFATRDEQGTIRNQENQHEQGTPCVSIFVGVTYVNLETDTTGRVMVIAEVPIVPPIEPQQVFVEKIFYRVAGFCFFNHEFKEFPLPLLRPLSAAADEQPKSVVHLTYVEACDCDFESMKDDAKDSLLVDRALVLLRLVHQCIKNPEKTLLKPLTVRTPGYGSKDAVGMPPIRTLNCYETVYRGDPRWPMVPPNSVCLECGKGPKHVDETMLVDKLEQCSKCRARRFCSENCLKKSWKSKLWPHKYECGNKHENDAAAVGASMRERLYEVAAQAEEVTVTPEKERIFQALVDEGDRGAFDRVAGSLAELYEQNEASGKKKRAARRNKKKKRGKK